MKRIFLPLAIACSALALWQSGLFIPTKPAIPWLLGLIMFGMGMTLSPKDFVGVVQRWKLVGFGLLAQYTVMPPLKYCIPPTSAADAAKKQIPISQPAIARTDNGFSVKP